MERADSRVSEEAALPALLCVASALKSHKTVRDRVHVYRPMMAEGCEAEALARALRGDEAGQRQIYQAYHAAAYRLAHLLLRDGMDAEEVVQDAFVYAFRHLDRYDPGRAAFWTWLRVILVSRCRNKRRGKRLSRVSLDVLNAVGRMPADAGPTNDPGLAVERFDTRREVYRALQQVSPGARDALVLRYYEGMPYAEMAEILGCSSDAARSRVAHGKSQLRRLLLAGKGSSATEHRAVRPAEAR
jgi:RNA polymerase sigma-70 factor (ECF subfamily)